MLLDYMCPECGAGIIYTIDGIRYSIEQMLTMAWPPQNATREVIHKYWCTQQKQEYYDRGLRMPGM